MIFLFIIRREIDPFPTSSIMVLCLYDMGIAGTVIHALLALITVHFTFPFLFFPSFHLNRFTTFPFPLSFVLLGVALEYPVEEEQRDEDTTRKRCFPKRPWEGI